jgi:integrase
MAVYSYRLANGQTRWFYIIDLPPGADGRRRQQKRSGFRDQRAAASAEAEAKARFVGADLNADGTVAAELAGWLAERELDVEPTTLSNYRDIVRCYIVPHIGARQLYTLDKRIIHDMYKTLLRSGGRDNAPLSPTTVRIVHRVLMKAVRDIGIIIEGVRQPRVLERQIMGRKGVWTPAQATAFLRHHAGHRLRAAWVLAIVVGVRRGELAGLRWSGVDLDRGVLLVYWQRTTTSGGVVEKAPKGKSRRAVAIGPALVAELRAHRARQDAEKALAGVVYRDGDYVFCREDGLPYYPKYFTDQWAKACGDAGVPVIALHDARHTSATTGADAGVPEHVMQRRLGHADARTTREVYTHVLPEAERKAAALMETVLGAARPQTSASR